VAYHACHGEFPACFFLLRQKQNMTAVGHWWKIEAAATGINEKTDGQTARYNRFVRF